MEVRADCFGSKSNGRFEFFEQIQVKTFPSKSHHLVEILMAFSSTHSAFNHQYRFRTEKSKIKPKSDQISNKFGLKADLMLMFYLQDNVFLHF